ncbi:MAG TPA: TonB-dependent receptor, partial [Sphingomicrobium sp.]|nr:TonB-dependent receptor [Sphingomicrobium sp.]
REVSLRSGTSVIAPSELVAGRLAPPLKGRYDSRQAVELLLEGSGLRARMVGDAIVVGRADRAAGEGTGSIPQPDASETIVVTGTHVRGGSPTSPLIRISRREIERSAPASVEELMRNLPQNVSGGVAQENFGVSGTGADITDHGAGVNLRGLGQRATLVLVNGRRIAPSGTGNFVDVSLIPVTAVDRVEILTDGASAIYGSDAVGGVVNFILRDDFEGLETLVQAGTATSGGGDQLLAGATAGGRWGSGRAMLSYEYRREDEIKARDREFTINLPDEWLLFPNERRHSLYGVASQDLGQAIRFELNAQFADRKTERSHFIAGPPIAVEAVARARSYGGTAALQADLGHSWSAELAGSWFRSRTRQSQVQPGGQGLFNIFNTINAFAELGLKLDGNLVDLPAGPVKLALGGLIRRERFESVFETLVNPPNPQSGKRTVRAAFGELHVPLFSDRNGRPGLERLVVTAAARLEDYDGLDASVDPKVGLLWSPLPGLDLRASYGTSFRAPLLYETLGYYNAFLFPASLLYIDPAEAPAGVGAALVGSDPGVQPETSKSFSIGFDWKPAPVPGLRLGATYYAIRFSNRIALPVDQIVVVGDPALEPIVTRNPDIGLVSGLLAGAGQVLDFSGPGFTNGGATPADVVTIVDVRISNTAETRTTGLDLALDYAFELGSNRIELGVNANKVLKFDDRLTPAAPVIHTLNTPFHPVDWRARASLAWSRGPLSGSLFLNYTAPYRDNRAGRSERVRSFTTLDAGIAWQAGAQEGGLLRGVRIALNAHNLLDQDPPRLLPDPASTRGVGYDPVNATGRGRSVALQVRKSW